MTTRPLRPCAHPGCPALVQSGRCRAHSRQVERQRGTAAERGYDARWRAYSLLFRAHHPLCGMRGIGAPVTKDSVCAREGRYTPSTLVDHINPVSGPDDPRFYDEANHQALCDECHNAKRQRESQGPRRQGAAGGTEVAPAATGTGGVLRMCKSSGP